MTANPGVPTVDSDVPCVGCGYILRGLPAFGLCPECGTSVQVSLSGHNTADLDGSSYAYVEGLVRGARLALVGIGAQVVLAVMTIGISLVGVAHAMANMSSQGGPAGSNPAQFTYVPPGWMTVLQVVLGIVGVLAAAVSAVGWWRMTAQDLSLDVDRSAPQRRKGVRLLVGFGFLLLLAYQAMVFASPSAPAQSFAFSGPLLTSVALGLLYWVVLAAGAALQVSYVGWLGERVRQPSVITQAKIYTWLVPVLLTVGACLVVGPLAAWVLQLIVVMKLSSALGERLRTHPGEASARPA